ncbi:MAG: GNAT family N-acetyltransferase [Candidatus Bathyarchaeota archaeon]|nr:MAG: GNAT family N-acetyltransferase [Candidatus Bathyarchaeota archaeon]
MKENEELTVKRLFENDAAEVEELLREVWPKAAEYPEKWRSARIIGQRQIMNEMKTGFHYFGVRLNRKIVGFYKARVLKDAYIGEHQSVHPAYRGRGLARAMYKHFIQFARETEYRRICVNVLPSQVASVKLMEKFGFKKVKEYEQIPGMLVHLYEKEIESEDATGKTVK